MKTLRLWDMSDREILYVIDEEADPANAGWTSSYDIADRLGITSDYPATSVGQRLSWLRRYGAVEKKEKESAWRLTRAGRALKAGQLAASDEALLDSMDSAQVLMLTRYLTGRYKGVGQAASNLIRREWQRGTQKPPPLRPRPKKAQA